MTREEFTKAYFPMAQSVTAGTGLFPETAIVQAILESSALNGGNWAPGASKLSAMYNNYFGIKAGAGWNGPTVNMNTGEYTPAGGYYSVNDAFRVYPDIESSFRDWVNFLKVNTRYSEVFKALNPYDQFHKLKDAGYATDPNYTSLLTSVYNSVKKYMPPPGASTALLLILAAGVLFFLINKK